ncbi:malonic semialdehyde reductase RutE [Candidatus Gugararchaeum adminiculabundum]|nr:malonic semialdehyde reductase RutE [Candidatus Gugararchaeum adminiculabundum]
MEFSEVVEGRFACREFDPKKEVEEKKLQKLLETVNLAPSAGNLQSYLIYVVREKAKREELAIACHEQDQVAQAPIVLVFVADKRQGGKKYGRRGEEFYCVQDATIATAYAQLAATDLGLATCWIGAFDPAQVAKIIKAKEWEMIVAVIPLGYANQNPEEKERKELHELVREV